MTKKNKRIIFITVFGIILTFSIGILLTTLSKNIMFFMTPTEVKDSSVVLDKVIRVGGLVKNGSVSKGKLVIEFVLTDCKSDVDVQYDGILPDLFREGQGIIATGKMENGILKATNLLAKHDERYIPKELYKASIDQNACKDG